MINSYLVVPGVIESAAPSEGKHGEQWQVKAKFEMSQFAMNLFMPRSYATAEQVMSGTHTFGLIRGRLKVIEGVSKDPGFNSNYYWNVVQFDLEGDGVKYVDVPTEGVSGDAVPHAAGGAPVESGKGAALTAAATLVASAYGTAEEAGVDNQDHLDNMFIETVRIAEGFNDSYFETAEDEVGGE